METIASEDGHRVDIYEYDRQCGGVITIFIFPVAPYVGKKNQILTVEYGPDGSFLTAQVWPDTETPEVVIASYQRRLKFIRTLAEQGDRDAAFELAWNFDEPKFIRTLAEQGDAQAAIELAKGFNELGPLKELAEQGDAQAAFNVYEQTIYRKEPTKEALKWLCVAANAGDAEAQKILAHLHRLWGVKEGYGIKENNRIAYMWYTLAAASGADTLGSRSIVAEEMTTEEEAEALEMVRDWKPGQCPAP